MRNVGEILYQRKSKLETTVEKSDGLKRRTYHFPYIATYRLYRRKTGSLERKAKDIYLKKL